ncbi:Uncharacterised protein [Achromobacter xylosoxidans]|nr:Uncharacterised protein [Achromobacter xylosoxidans]CUJ88139.1 Uncharacterised protein [Achromobacter xylosoxidans]
MMISHRIYDLCCQIRLFNTAIGGHDEIDNHKVEFLSFNLFMKILKIGNPADYRIGHTRFHLIQYLLVLLSFIFEYEYLHFIL